MEPSWFRFQLQPDVEFGNAGTPNSFGSIPNVQAFFANLLVAGEPNTIPAITDLGTGLPISALGDPVTPVFRHEPGQASRMYVLNGASADRDGTFILTGHVWPRDPYVCTGNALAVTGSNAGTVSDPMDATVPLVGRCDPAASVPSTALGLNMQAKYMGGQEGMGHTYGHWPILFDAGGQNAIPGDFLARDYAPNGYINGQFSILRVE